MSPVDRVDRGVHERGAVGARERGDAVWAGPYVISVSDRSAKDGFRLSGPGVTRWTAARKWRDTRRGEVLVWECPVPEPPQDFTVYG